MVIDAPSSLSDQQRVKVVERSHRRQSSAAQKAAGRGRESQRESGRAARGADRPTDRRPTDRPTEARDVARTRASCSRHEARVSGSEPATTLPYPPSSTLRVCQHCKWALQRCET